MGSPVLDRTPRKVWVTVRPSELTRFSVGIISVTALMSLLWLVLWAGLASSVGGWSPVVVTTGSMAPRIDIGDVVLIAAPKTGQTVAPQTVIVFENPARPGFVTHRVIAIDEEGRYITQGDANPRVDSTPVPPESIAGAAEILVPMVGMPAVWFGRGQWVHLVAAAAALAGAVWASQWVFGTGPKLRATAVVAGATADLVARLRVERVARLAAPIATLLLATVLTANTTTSVAAFASPVSSQGNSFVVDVWKSVVGLDGGISHACLTRSEGYVWCWGRNDKGQLGDNTTDDSYVPVEVVGIGGSGVLSDVVDVASGGSSNCAVHADGTTSCWGLNSDGQLGDNTTDDSLIPVPVTGPGGSGTLSGVTDVAVGLNHSCAAKMDGTVWCWGRNDDGQLGDNTTSDSSVPVQVVGSGGSGTLSGVSTVAAGSSTACAVKTDGTVWCWGRNDKGQLGDNTTSDSSTPVQVVGVGGTGTLTGVIGVSVGEKHTCATKTDTTVWCWGTNAKGQLGDNSTSDSSTPVQVVGSGGSGTLAGATGTASGLSHNCANKSDGTVWCWGLNDKGQLGDNTTADSSAPVQTVGPDGTGTLAGAVLVGAGDAFSCAALGDWPARCWGRNDYGQLGDNTTADSSAPVQVKGAGWTGVFADAVALASGLGHTCAVKSDGTVWCWGRNGYGQLGDNTTGDSLSPTIVRGPGGIGTLSDIAALAAGDQSTCAQKIDGTVWCWGRNDDGQLGDNTTTDSSVPVQVVGSGGLGALSNVAALAGGQFHNCASKSDNTAWCWGRNDKGQLGDNTTSDSAAPVQVVGPGGTGTLANATSMAAGQSHSCAVKSDATAWCWGFNGDGQLGDNTTSDSSAPVQVVGSGGTGTLTNVTSVAAGESHTCGVKSDTTALCWGRNNKGQLGDNTTSDSTAPVQVTGLGGSGTLTSASSVTAGLFHSCVIKTDSTMWCWGLNSDGQLGDDTTSDTSSPVQVTDEAGVGTIVDAVTGAAGADFTCVVRTDSTVWCWGRNHKGQLGDGTTDDTTSPKQVI